MLIFRVGPKLALFFSSHRNVSRLLRVLITSVCHLYLVSYWLNVLPSWIPKTRREALGTLGR
jgi:hypothetical protein